jgi:Tfp pilus assembly protein PilN
MIKVNLTGVPKKKAFAPAARSTNPSNILPVLHLAILAAALVGGYIWYSNLRTQTEQLAASIQQREIQLKQLEAVIKQDQIYETLKTTLKNRIEIIEGLRKNQVSPLLILDMLGDAVDRTRYVWLSNMSQNNTTITMSGTATTVDALADLVRNMEATGYFHNINPQRFEDSRGYFAFNMTCEFAPPAPSTPAPASNPLEPAVKGAN